MFYRDEAPLVKMRYKTNKNSCWQNDKERSEQNKFSFDASQLKYFREIHLLTPFSVSIKEALTSINIADVNKLDLQQLSLLFPPVNGGDYGG
ncbi:MAG: hypothetical protein CV087_13965 [Candidatus Brocadia sp. WS118]|nr:MAG: hypothetical protein CV087_13965 [Candidatus Brocadia sp. WS118]